MDAPDALIWQEGSGGTRTHLGDNEVIRCWNLQNRFDCLHAEIFDIRAQIADAPVRRSYYRFITSHLPVRRSQLAGLDTSDGYECSASSTRDRSSFLETIWKDGRIVAQSATDEGAPDSMGWTPQRIVALFEENEINPRRPYFACPLVEDITTGMGLQTLDSPLVTYESLIQFDRYPATEETVAPAG